MVDISLAILNRLAAASPVTSLIGSRVYPEYKRQINRVYPLVIYKIDVSMVDCFDGPSGVAKASVRLAAIAETYAQAGLVASAIIAALDGASGTWANIVVQGVFLQDQGITDGVITDPDTEEILYYAKEVAFDVTFNTAPAA